MSKDKRIVRPRGREEVSTKKHDPVSGKHKLTGSRPPLVAPAPVRLATEDVDRMPREIARDVKKWCKRNLKKNEKIHRDDLLRAISATMTERKRWGNAVKFLSDPLSQDRLIHITKGYWKKHHVDPTGKNKIDKIKTVRGPRLGKKYKGRVMFEGNSISYTEAVFEIEDDNNVIGINIVVPHIQIEGNERLRELFERGGSITDHHKVNMIHEAIKTEYSPGSRRPGTRRKLKRERVIRSRLLGAWVGEIKSDPLKKMTIYTIFYDDAERL